MSATDLDIENVLIERYLRFRRHSFPERRELFAEIADKQSPSILFITCSDSRVVSSVILDGDPGDIFECRVVGNIVPPYGDSFGGVSATIEYAVTVLRVAAIIICGHSNCGAMQALQNLERYRDFQAIGMWLRHAEAARRVTEHLFVENADSAAVTRSLTEENIIAQLENLQTHPAVAAGRRRGLAIFGWFYDIGSGTIERYHEQTHRFLPLDAGRESV